MSKTYLALGELLIYSRAKKDFPLTLTLSPIGGEGKTLETI